MKKLWNNCKVAFAMYSKIPMPKADWAKENMKYALCFFPWIGLVIGVLEAAAFKILGILNAGPVFICAILTFLPVLITGGIHLDGYLDTMDALSSWREKERRLEILKDPHAGAFAVIMGCSYFLLYAGAASELCSEIFPAYSMGFAVSRALSGLSLLFFPNANPKGTAAAFSNNAEKKRTAAVLVLTLVIVTSAAIILSGWYGILTLMTSLGVFGFYYYKSKKYFGGITGDLAGYFLSLCELLQLIVLVLAHLGMECWL
ncbi:MAG: adenosylcobinamide-GDP ribazoletransferase [Fusicatenibacter sp.]